MNAEVKTERIVTLHVPVTDLDEQLPATMLPTPLRPWPETGYNVRPHLKTGIVLGAFAGCTSLLTKIVGSVLWPAISGFEQHPLRLIQVCLTFPLGESVLRLQSGVLLALGCMLYVGTGMLKPRDVTQQRAEHR